MDPLSVTASIAGLLTAVHEVVKILGPFVSAAGSVPQIAFKVLSEVQNTKTILTAVKNLIVNINAKSFKHASLIKVDQIVTILTDGVMIFSELESAAGCLLLSVPTSQLLQLRCRLQWARKEGIFTSLLGRLESFKNSLSLILDILQYDSDLRAERHRTELSAHLHHLIESNEALANRLSSLEDIFDARTFIVPCSTTARTVRSSNNTYLQIPGEWHEGSEQSIIAEPKSSVHGQTSYLPMAAKDTCISVFEFDADLEASWVYRRAKRDTMDYSFRSSIGRSHAWSILSGMSLSEISIISVIALPIGPEHLTNSQHYAFGGDDLPLRSTQPHIIFDRDRSIYHDCLEIKSQMMKLFGFPALFHEAKGSIFGAKDPMNELRHVFRQGFPLLMLLNNWKFDYDISMFQGADDSETARLIRTAVHEFLFACGGLLQMNPGGLFTVEDLIGKSNVGFMKVVTVLAMVLAELPPHNTMQTLKTHYSLLRENKKKARVYQNQHSTFVEEFVRDERVYLLQLEQLLESKIAIEKRGMLHNQQLDEIFGPVSIVMDHQIQFLLDMEINLSKPVQEQRWAQPFLVLKYGQTFWAYQTLVVEEKKNKSIIESHILGLEDRIEEEYLGTLTACYNLLSMPRVRLDKHHNLLEVIRPIQGRDVCALWWRQKREVEAALLLVQSIKSRVEADVDQGSTKPGV